MLALLGGIEGGRQGGHLGGLFRILVMRGEGMNEEASQSGGT